MAVGFRSPSGSAMLGRHGRLQGGLEALAPRAVVAGHKIPDHDDDPRHIAETPQYLRDFNRLDQTTDTPRELFDAMIELYPDRANPGSLWGGANAAKAAAASTAS
jgi:hypothetical protein